jgi:deoxyribodipyrimidine photo-lyase
VSRAADWDLRHGRFVWQSLQDMQKKLDGRGGKILVLHREAKEALDLLQERFSVRRLYSHQETGNRITYDRDLAVGEYCRAKGIEWREFAADGVVRRLRSRKDWIGHWNASMSEAQAQPDWEAARFAEWSEVDEKRWQGKPLPREWLTPDEKMQPGGTTTGRRYLESFLKERCQHYNTHLSKPLLSRRSCGRISPYLAWGNLSHREVVQLTETEMLHSPWKWHLEGFASRLRWRSHFMQKFEREIRMETENLNRGYAALDMPLREEFYQAWETGQTGFPLVDAAMRCVVATGYLNFRMRAMVVSFLTHHLWQPWQRGSRFLARQFLDYEPGIHYPQFQMQAGILGTNTIRIYNPVKQAADHDPGARFIKTWLPELGHLPPALAREPWNMTAMEAMLYGYEPGKTYPRPIVDLEKTHAHARDTLHRLRQAPLTRKESQRILKVHTNPGRKTR